MNRRERECSTTEIGIKSLQTIADNYTPFYLSQGSSGANFKNKKVPIASSSLGNLWLKNRT